MPDDLDLTAELDAAGDGTSPICLSVAFQMGPLRRHSLIGEGYTGDLRQFAEDMTRYLVTNLERFGDPRGADLFIAVAAQRGDEMAAHEFRSGRYVKDGGSGQITTTPATG